MKPAHIWWLGVIVFLPGFFLWIYWLVLCLSRFGQFGSLNWYGICHTYLPLLAAIVGLGTPLLCLLRFRNSSTKVAFGAFSVYLMVLLTWGVLDIKNENYQIGGHDSLGHRDYWHLYFTWYFFPYRWIHGYNFD
jgi:hypothetical protein